MALSTKSAIFGVRDAKITPMLTDVVGSATTYGTELDVPGIKKVDFSITSTTVKNEGDERILDIEEMIDEVSLSWENAHLDLAVLAAINGGAVTADGVTPAMSQTYEFAGTESGGYFKFRCLAKKGSGAVKEAELTIHKVRGTLTFSFVGKGFATCSFKGTGIATEGTVNTKANSLYAIKFDEAAIV